MNRIARFIKVLACFILSLIFVYSDDPRCQSDGKLYFTTYGLARLPALIKLGSGKLETDPTFMGKTNGTQHVYNLQNTSESRKLLKH